jgi:hypothetical protein
MEFSLDPEARRSPAKTIKSLSINSKLLKTR